MASHSRAGRSAAMRSNRSCTAWVAAEPTRRSSVLGAGSTTRAAEQVFSECEQRPGRHALGRVLLQPLAQPLLGDLIELVPAQVAADTRELDALGGRPLGVG